MEGQSRRGAAAPGADGRAAATRAGCGSPTRTGTRSPRCCARRPARAASTSTSSTSGSRRRTPRRPTATWCRSPPTCRPSPPGARPVPPRPTRPPAYRPAYPSSLAVMGETRRGGVWRVEPHQWAFALMGSVVLDLREAQFTSRDVLINANALMGRSRSWWTRPTGGRRGRRHHGRLQRAPLQEGAPPRGRRRAGRAGQGGRGDGLGQRQARHPEVTDGPGQARVRCTRVTVSGRRRGIQKPRVARARPLTRAPAVGPSAGNAAAGRRSSRSGSRPARRRT